MTLDNWLKILLAGASLCLGAYLAALRTKIGSEKIKNKLHYGFYGICILFFIASVATTIFCWNDIIYEEEKFKPNWFAIIVLLLCAGSTFILFFYTKKNIVGKHQYNLKELDPIVNKFTENADKNNIRLLAGDINFFGNSPHEMDSNSQYICLKAAAFRQIEILCLRPQKTDEKIRYGKILNDLPQVQLRYYNPPKADLNLRGRLKTLNNVTHLLMYNKIQSGIYEAVMTDTANNSGALYNHIWSLIWDLAEQPTQEETDEYESLFRN